LNRVIICNCRRTPRLVHSIERALTYSFAPEKYE
jgi:hypothetical protein